VRADDSGGRQESWGRRGNGEVDSTVNPRTPDTNTT